jgi:hypothetical protein
MRQFKRNVLHKADLLLPSLLSLLHTRDSVSCSKLVRCMPRSVTTVLSPAGPEQPVMCCSVLCRLCQPAVNHLSWYSHHCCP